MATHRVYQGRDVVLCEGVKIDTSHESAEDMWESLGWHEDWESAHSSGCVVHPVCTIEQLDTLTDAQILETVCPRDERCTEARAAYVSAVKYARSALADMRSIESSLAAAVENYERGDLAGTIEHLTEARREESEYGDCPATNALADMLLDDYEAPDEGEADAETIDAAR